MNTDDALRYTYDYEEIEERNVYQRVFYGALQNVFNFVEFCSKGLEKLVRSEEKKE